MGRVLNISRLDPIKKKESREPSETPAEAYNEKKPVMYLDLQENIAKLKQSRGLNPILGCKVIIS